MNNRWIVNQKDPVLVTGASGFVGSRTVNSLLRRGFEDVRCLVRPAGDVRLLKKALHGFKKENYNIIEGNLLSKNDCDRAVEGVNIVYHLVAGRGKSFPGCFQGSVITTRNLLNSLLQVKKLKRLVNVSSFAVYSNLNLKKGALWDETCDIENNLEKRYDSYVYGKIKQDKIIFDYHQKYGIPYTIVRPGIVFGPGKIAIPGFVGIDTFGFFMHLGGSNPIPLTYVDNCADAITLAGLVQGVESEVFNVVDDELPTSRQFLRQYKKQVRRFRSIWIPYSIAYTLCYFWERYAAWSKGQLPPIFNRRMCAFAWKGHYYSNEKLKQRLGWKCRVPMREALKAYYAFQMERGSNYD